MPDRPQGYWHHKRGLLPPDLKEAKRYRERQAEATAVFTHAVQRVMVRAILAGELRQRLALHYIATEPAHVHVLVHWSDGRWAESVRDRLKQSMTRALNAEVVRRRWFVRKGWVERVRRREHFDHLLESYLPSHPGWGWRRGRGWVAPRR